MTSRCKQRSLTADQYARVCTLEDLKGALDFLRKSPTQWRRDTAVALVLRSIERLEAVNDSELQLVDLGLPGEECMGCGADLTGLPVYEHKCQEVAS